jgi:hypothetical protein
MCNRQQVLYISKESGLYSRDTNFQHVEASSPKHCLISQFFHSTLLSIALFSALVHNFLIHLIADLPNSVLSTALFPALHTCFLMLVIFVACARRNNYEAIQQQLEA